MPAKGQGRRPFRVAQGACLSNDLLGVPRSPVRAPRHVEDRAGGTAYANTADGTGVAAEAQLQARARRGVPPGARHAACALVRDVVVHHDVCRWRPTPTPSLNHSTSRAALGRWSHLQTLEGGQVDEVVVAAVGDEVVVVVVDEDVVEGTTAHAFAADAKDRVIACVGATKQQRRQQQRRMLHWPRRGGDTVRTHTAKNTAFPSCAAGGTREGRGTSCEHRHHVAVAPA
jgi:hypothetical protein